MKTLSISIGLAFVAVGCGSSIDPGQKPAQATPTVTEDAGSVPPDATPAAAVRTLVSAPLMYTSPKNLILDASFRDQGWGHFYTLYETSFEPLTRMPIALQSDSPAGVGATVVTIKDSTATDVKSRGIIAIAPFLGGPGPFVAQVWVSYTSAGGAPLELPNDPLYFRASITTGGLPEGKAYDLKREESATKTFGTRTWYLYKGRVDVALENAFFNLKLGRKGGGYLISAPEVVPQALLDTPEPKAFSPALVARAITAEEVGAVAAYAKQPIQLAGAPKPKGVPGKSAGW